MTMQTNMFSSGAEFAAELDANDPLASVRAEFSIPAGESGEPAIYLVGNSLGLISKRARDYVDLELDRWGEFGVEGHFTGTTQWTRYQDLMVDQMAAIVGAKSDEVVLMNSLTVNLHLLMISFYDPTPQRHKILIEEHAFPSDHFAVESQIRQRGFDPVTSMVVVKPRKGADTLHPEDILATIAAHGNELALVLLPGVQYYTGQVLDMEAITKAGHEVGAKVGFDLAHGAGNVLVKLGEWDVDFAAWCTYKYLNSGPGGIGGAFVNERFLNDQSLKKLTGWWGTNKETRFEMSNSFDAITSAESWQLSCSAVLSMAPLRASLELIDEVGGIESMRSKAELQIRYMDYLMDTELGSGIESLTPKPMSERGCQFALRVTDPNLDGRQVFEQLRANGVSLDWRYPDVIRVAPVPLYNSFADIHRFVQILKKILGAGSGSNTP